MSRVSVRSGQSVVLGGLIRENAIDNDSGIPFLYKLPLVGPLFGATKKENNRTELLVIITPRALVSENDLHEVSEEMRSQHSSYGANRRCSIIPLVGRLVSG